MVIGKNIDARLKAKKKWFFGFWCKDIKSKRKQTTGEILKMFYLKIY